MAWIRQDGFVIGAMPRGPQKFNSFEEYEDAYIDAIFDENNGFSFDLPEDF